MGVKKDWARCIDCGERRLVVHREWLRASKPRCLRCGGVIEPSFDAVKGHVKHRDALVEIREVNDKKTGRAKKRVDP